MIFTAKDKISFEIDKNNYTAKVIFSPNAKGNIIIPRYFNYDSQNYVIQTIGEDSFKGNNEIKSISFSEDSELLKIEQNAFTNSSIKKIFFPPSLKELEDGWNKLTRLLTDVYLSDKSSNFSYLDNNQNIIIGKSNPNQKKFDTIVFVNPNIHEITIPSYIKHIKSYSFANCKYINSIEFSEGSEMLSIEKNVFYCSSIKSITLSSTNAEFEEGWCNHTIKLNEIKISENNDRFSYLNSEKKVVFGKSKNCQSIFDCLVFASRKIRQVLIPSSVKRICSYSFAECKKLSEVKFTENSELVSIGEYSFFSTSIENVCIPKNVEIIEEGAFSFCTQLKTIQFCEDSKLRTIEKGAFENTLVENIIIPSYVDDLKDGWNRQMKFLITVSISEKNKNFSYLDFEKKIIVGKSEQSIDIFDVIVFACRDVTEVKIPSYIKYINSFSFSKCNQIESFEISENSELNSIGNECFSHSSIRKFIAPPHLKHIGQFCFESCNLFHQFEFSESSELLSIEMGLFENSALSGIKVPSNIKKIGKFAFQDCYNLESIEFSNDSELESIDSYSFAYSSLKKIFIPTHVKKIGTAAFINSDIEEVEFSENSELCLIENQAFQFTQIKRIKIPDHVKQISEYFLFGCQKLESVEFSENSELKLINDYSFSESSIEKISIPSKVEEISSRWCINTPKFTQISLSKKNDNFLYYEDKMIIGKTEEKNDTLFYVKHDITNIIIPSFVKYISSYCFAGCQNLEKVEFAENSELRLIDDCAFYGTPIRCISIPSKLEALKDGWCNNTANLTNISISTETNRFLYIDEKMVVFKTKENFDFLNFVNRDVESIEIPSQIVEIGPWSFDECQHLKKVTFSENSELKIIHENAFFNSSIEEIFIPTHVKTIHSFAFNLCNKLKKVVFAKDSELRKIKHGAFYDSALSEIKIPSSVKSIGKNAFYSCLNLRKIEFEENSQLRSIEPQFLYRTQIRNIVIPKNVNLVQNNGFTNCQLLGSIEFLGDNLTFCDSVFCNCVSLRLISFPNAREVKLYDFIKGLYQFKFVIYFLSGAKVIFYC